VLLHLVKVHCKELGMLCVALCSSRGHLALFQMLQ